MTEARFGSMWLSLLGVFVLALVIRVGATAMFVGLDAPPSASANPDQLDYDAFAWRVAQGAGYTLADGTPTARRPPGTSLMLAPVYLIFGHSFVAARLWFCVLSAATCALCVLLGAMTFGRRAGLIAGVVLALYPGHFYYAMHLVSETPYALWLAMAVMATLTSVRRSSMRWAVVAGLLWAAAMLVRPQVVLLPAMVVPFVLLLRKQAIIRGAAVQCVVLVIAVAPWLVRNKVAVDRASFTTSFGHLMWGAHNEVTFSDPAHMGDWIATSTLLAEKPFRGSEAEVDQYAMQQAKAEIAAHWAQMPRLVAMKLVRFVQPVHDTPNRAVALAFTVGWGVVGLLTLVGVVLAWRRDRCATVVLLLPLVATVALTMLTYGIDRFRDSSAPLFVPLAAVAIDAVLVWLRTTAQAVGQSEITSVVDV